MEKLKRKAPNQSPLSTVQGKAFTLIELLVVIAIIGILSALIIVGMNSTTEKARIAKSQVFSNSLRNSLMGNLVSEWKFDAINSPAANQTPDLWGSNTGTLGDGSTASTFPTLVAAESSCVSGKCFSFDGGDYVNIGDPASGNLDFGTGNYTISAWVKPASLSGSGYTITAKQNSGYTDIAGWGLQIYQDDLFFFILDGLGSAGRVQRKNDIFIQAGAWYHVVVVCNYNSSIDFYINAAEPSTYDYLYTAWSTLSNAQNFQIGAVAGASRLFNGSIDDVRIFNAAMPTSQIQRDYFAGLNKLLVKNQISTVDYNQRLVKLVDNYAKQ